VLGLVGGSLEILLELLSLGLCLTLGRLEALVVCVDPADLCGADGEDQGIDGSKGDVLGPDDEAPAGPDGAGAHEGKVLGEGEGLCGAGEVGGACEDHAPFHDGRPVVGG
jgi:hypothetical protein